MGVFLIWGIFEFADADKKTVAIFVVGLGWATVCLIVGLWSEQWIHSRIIRQYLRHR